MAPTKETTLIGYLDEAKYQLSDEGREKLEAAQECIHDVPENILAFYCRYCGETSLFWRGEHISFCPHCGTKN